MIVYFMCPIQVQCEVRLCITNYRDAEMPGHKDTENPTLSILGAEKKGVTNRFNG